MTISSAGARPKALVIGLDGLRFARVAQADAPRLQGLLRDGWFASSLLQIRGGAETMSGPGWSTMASGVWPDKHGVRDNTFAGQRYAEHPDFLTMLKRARPDLTTFAALNWPPLHGAGTFSAEIDTILLGDGEEDGYYPEDARMTAGAAELLRDHDPAAGFAYLGCIDAAGHGWGATSAEYLDAIGRADGWVGELIDAIAARPTYRQERWLVLLTTDHGHTDTGGHGGFSDAERQSFILAAGPGVPAGGRGAGQLVDIAPTVLHHFGVAVPDRLDGRPLCLSDLDTP